MDKPTYQFTKAQRLLNPKEFKQVFDAPIKKIHSPHLLLFVGCGQTDTARLGLAITKKKLKNATDRNRLKRVMREGFRLHQHKLPVVDVVLIVKQKFDKSVDIQDEIAEILQKLERIQPS